MTRPVGATGANHVRRIGDPFAPAPRHFRGGKYAIPLVAAVLICLAVVSTIHWIQVGDSARLIANCVGIGLALLVSIGALVGWRTYWGALADQVGHARRAHPEDFVIGARVVHVDTPGMARTALRDQLIRSRHVVIRADHRGVTVTSVSGTGVDDLALSWKQLRRLEQVEAVEGGRTYEAIALGESGGPELLLQPVTSPGVASGFPVGEDLRRVVGAIESLRPEETA